MPRPIRAVIRTDALAHNLHAARAAAPGARIWAVVKANAYGHGIERAHSGLQAADGFALLDFDEAARLRQCGWAGPILLLEGFFDSTDIASIGAMRLTPMLHNDEQISMLEHARLEAPIDVFIKINTGMNRLGFRPDRFASIVARLKAMPQIASITPATHFADADTSRGIGEQLGAFDRVAHQAPGKATLSNSAAILEYPNAHRAWVRAGILLYGASPFADRSAHSLGLRPAMSLNSEIIATQTLEAGETVGYGSTFTASRAMRIGVVACGYADGYPRHAPNGTPVWIDGAICSVAGRVSMDMIMVDLTNAPHAHVGSPAQLWGEHVPIDDVAHAAKTVGYELMCALAARVPVTVEREGA